jgi:hypothetical protein
MSEGTARGDESIVDHRPPADEEPAALAGEASVPGANQPLDGEHSCQPPREDPPSVGSEWECPECGRRWLLDDVSHSEEGGPGQRLTWKLAASA